MPTIALVNQKGGCSKSTTAVHLCYWLATKKKHRVLLVDADAQRSSSTWVKSLDIEIPFKVLQSPDDILDELPHLAGETDYLIVDGPAGISESTRTILLRADMAIIPCQPTGVDLHSATETVRLVKQAQSVRNGLPKAAMFLSRVVKGTKLLDEAIVFLNQIPEVPTLKASISQKQVIADTFGQAATVWQMVGRPARESEREYDKLFKELMGVMK